MYLTLIEIEDLRIVESARLSPAPGINLISGANGSGKTSLLEAIYLASRGRSFRHPDGGPMIRHEAERTRVLARIAEGEDGRERVLGVMRDRRQTQARLDGVDVRKRSISAAALPVQLITSQPQLLLGSGPEVRRRFLDMGLFHVEQGFLGVFADFRRALSQRNAALRTRSPEQIESWSRAFETAAARLDALRTTYVERLAALTGEILTDWGVGFAVHHRYRPGWPADQALGEALRQRISAEMELGHTAVGPQRAEWVFTVEGALAEKRLSRGQQKILVFAINLALQRLVTSATRRPPVLLVDDIGAELDTAHRALVIDALKSSASQVFATTLDAADVGGGRGDTGRWFHVEHGEVVVR